MQTYTNRLVLGFDGYVGDTFAALDLLSHEEVLELSAHERSLRRTIEHLVILLTGGFDD